jgi:ornithine decarboxylase
LKELREIINLFTKHDFVKHSFYAFYPVKVWDQVGIWKKNLPYITPHYAIKSNPEPQLIKTLYSHGVKYDCASLQELKLVKENTPNYVNLHSHIVYANPCKSMIDLKYAQKEVSSPTTVVDSYEELDKLVEIKYEGGAFVRITTDDRFSKIPFSGKFGIEPSFVNDIGLYAKSKNINLKGISFHVGSGGNDGKVYYNSIEIAKKLCNSLKEQGHSANTIDIGGGFLSDETDFVRKCKYIKDAYDSKYEFIAEPGRFFSSVSQDFFVKVIGKKPWKDGWRYTIDDSLYGQFSCIPFDQAKPLWIRVSEDNELRRKSKGILMGRTCDSVDVIAKCNEMEELEIGDWLWFPQMGSYTNATANEFNGFPKPPTIPVYLKTTDISNYVGRMPESISTVEPISSASLLY